MKTPPRLMMTVNGLDLAVDGNSTARLEERDGRLELSAFIGADSEALANSALDLDAYYNGFGISVTRLPILADVTRYTHDDARDSRHHVWAFLCHDHEALKRFTLVIRGDRLDFEGLFLLHESGALVTSLEIAFGRALTR